MTIRYLVRRVFVREDDKASWTFGPDTQFEEGDFRGPYGGVSCSIRTPDELLVGVRGCGPIHEVIEDPDLAMDVGL